jgi:putative nucleotidyltransferase with HDIG domain
VSGVLVVNPNADERKSLAEAIGARGWQVGAASSIQEALHTLARQGYERIISVRTLPDGSGELLAQQAREVSPGTTVMLVTNFSQVRGAADILRFDFSDYIIDVDDLAGLLTGAVRGPGPSQRDLVECFLRTVETVIGLVELDDPLTAGNAASSMRLAEGVAREMGLPEERRQEVALSALLHDIGNFALKTGVLDKSGPLEPKEETAIRQHTLRGVQLLEHIDFPWKIKPIILHHHERYDGSGYPDGKKGRAIPIAARILSVVDAYLSMTTRRPHRQTLSHEAALGDIQAGVGTQFDPEVVEAFNSFVERRKKFAGDLFQVTILVLEGSEDSLSRMKFHFLREDFKILSCGSIQEGLETIERQDIRFLVADITHDWDESLRILDALQDRIETSKTDVLFFDGEDSRERRVTALDNGAEEVYPLDVSPGEVIGRMRRILRKEEAVRRGSTLARENAGIEGELSEMNLAELLQMLSMGQKTARITIESPGINGKAFLETGRLTHVEVGEEEGPEAFRRLLDLRKGRFRISHGVTTPRRSIDRDAMSVLLDALRSMDEETIRDDRPAAP